MPNIIHSGGGVNIMTLPDQITNLACVGGTDGTAGTIDVSFTEVPASSWSLLQNYLLVYKAGSIPQTPFDGMRVVLPKGTAGAQKTYQITGLTYNQLYGVRIYPVSVKNQYQTSAEGATAAVTPVAGIDAGTLTVELKIAIPVKLEYQSKLGAEIIWKVADQNHSGYPANSTSLISDNIIAMLAFDSREPSNSNKNRQDCGNNRYSVCNQLQWLNSSAADGQWYSAQHAYDAPPEYAGVSVNPYDAWAGFLHMLDDEFVASLLDTTVIVAKNTETDGGGSETVTAKMHLPSTTEVGCENENGIAEGSKLALFSGDASRKAYLTQEALNTSHYTPKPTISTPWQYLLRTPRVTTTYHLQVISTSGALTTSGNLAYYGYEGIRPICNISSTFKLKTQPRGDGCYEPLWV